MRAAIYIRVSTDKDEQKTSLDYQKALFYNYVAEKGWDISRFYIDIESGTTEKRKELQNLIADANQKKYDVILAKELSRIARNGKLSYEIRDIAEKNRIHIITLDNAVNTLTGEGNMFGLYAWMYEQESQRTSERIKSSFSSKAKRGEFKGSIPPYGYVIEEGKLLVRHDNTPDVVRRVFRMYLQGLGFDAIARMLTREDYATPAQVAQKKSNVGLRWNGSSIKLFLSNPHYVGDLVQNRETTRSVTSKVREIVPVEKQIIVKDSHDGIISREDYDAVQLLMNSRKKKRPKCKKHLFTKSLFAQTVVKACGTCKIERAMCVVRT